MRLALYQPDIPKISARRSVSALACTLILGRESAGSDGELYAAAQASVRIPMAAGVRSLNVITAAALVLGEAMRQTGAWEKLT